MEKVKLHTRMYGWKHVWMEFAEEFQGTVDDPNPDSSQSGMSIMVPMKNSASVLVFTLEPGKNGSPSRTTIETAYSGGGNFKFGLHPQKGLSALTKLLGMQDIIVGYKDFDPRFVVKGNDAGKVRDIFADGELRTLVLQEPSIEISAQPNSTDSNPSPRILSGNQSTLCLKLTGIVDDFERLRSLYSLMGLLLVGVMAEQSNIAVPDGAAIQVST